MGHTNMLLAVAGLDKDALNDRTRKLASGDWSSFPALDRAAFFYARNISKEPWKLGPQDLNTLVAHAGPHRTIDVIWWTARCHYMTRVADAFQIPLERKNVFQRR